MINRLKRIIAVNDKNNRATIIKDEVLNLKEGPGVINIDTWPSAQAVELFLTADCPQTYQSLQKDADVKPNFSFPLNDKNFQFILIKFPPTKTIMENAKAKGEVTSEDYRQFALHSTDSIDYCMIVTGELKAIIGDDEKNFSIQTLKQGDVIILGGVKHTWWNDGPEDCYMVAAKFGVSAG